MKYEFGFIGCGNMGGAIVNAVSKTVECKSIAVCDTDIKKCEEFSDRLGVVTTDIKEISENSKYIVFGVKPQIMEGVASEIREILAKRTDEFIIVTMAAGINMELLGKYLGGAYPIIRIMPNTPVAIGEGVVLCTRNESVSDDKFDAFKHCMDKAGIIDEIPEKLIDAGSAVSGCGPAFAAVMIEAMADGGVECGLPRDKALKYAAKTFAGTAKLLIETGKHPGKLKDEVCSPGGTTIEGVHTLENGAVRGNIMNAVKAAYEKNSKLVK